MSLLKEGKTNWKYILIVVILAAIVGGGILSYLFPSFSFIFFVFLGFLPALVITFGIFYLIVWGSFKLFHITGISQSKIIIFIFAILLLGFLSYSIFSYFRLKEQFMKVKEVLLGLPLESEIKPSEDIYKNEKYGFEIKYFTDRLAIENDYETERLRGEPRLLFRSIFNDSNYGWNIGKTTGKPAMAIEIFECLENTLDGCLNQIPNLQPTKYKEITTSPLTEFNGFPAKELKISQYVRLEQIKEGEKVVIEGEDEKEGIVIFGKHRLYVILVLTSSKIYKPVPEEIFNQMLSTFTLY